MLDNVTPLDAERRGSVENPLTPLSSVHLVDAMLRRWGRVTTSGQTVTPEAALGVSAVFAGIDFIAGTIASLPMHVYRRRDGGREGVAPQSLGGRV